MGAFLPSEVARLVLGYLEEQGCMRAYDEFLKGCRHLEECRGRGFFTTIMGLALSDILEDYCAVHSYILDLDNGEDFRKRIAKCRSLLEKVKFISEGNTDVEIKAEKLSQSLQARSLGQKSKHVRSNSCDSVITIKTEILDMPPRAASIERQDRTIRNSDRRCRIHGVTRSNESLAEATSLADLPGNKRFTQCFCEPATPQAMQQSRRSLPSDMNIPVTRGLSKSISQVFKENLNKSLSNPKKNKYKPCNMEEVEFRKALGLVKSTQVPDNNQSSSKRFSSKLKQCPQKKSFVNDSFPSDSFNVTTLTNALLDCPELHEKLAENINRIINNSSSKLVHEIIGEANKSQEETLTLKETSKDQTDIITIDDDVPQLDTVIKSIVEKTEKDPIFDQLVTDVLAASVESSSDSDAASGPSTSTPEKSCSSKKNEPPSWIKKGKNISIGENHLRMVRNNLMKNDPHPQKCNQKSIDMLNVSPFKSFNRSRRYPRGGKRMDILRESYRGSTHNIEDDLSGQASSSNSNSPTVDLKQDEPKISSKNVIILSNEVVQGKIDPNNGSFSVQQVDDSIITNTGYSHHLPLHSAHVTVEPKTVSKVLVNKEASTPGNHLNANSEAANNISTSFQNLVQPNETNKIQQAQTEMSNIRPTTAPVLQGPFNVHIPMQTGNIIASLPKIQFVQPSVQYLNLVSNAEKQIPAEASVVPRAAMYELKTVLNRQRTKQCDLSPLPSGMTKVCTVSRVVVTGKAPDIVISSGNIPGSASCIANVGSKQNSFSKKQILDMPTYLVGADNTDTSKILTGSVTMSEMIPTISIPEPVPSVESNSNYYAGNVNQPNRKWTISTPIEQKKNIGQVVNSVQFHQGYFNNTSNTDGNSTILKNFDNMSIPLKCQLSGKSMSPQNKEESFIKDSISSQSYATSEEDHYVIDEGSKASQLPPSTLVSKKASAAFDNNENTLTDSYTTAGLNVVSNDLIEQKRNTPDLIIGKRSSSSTPRRSFTHVRVLDFNTPPRGSEDDKRRTQSSPKQSLRIHGTSQKSQNSQPKGLSVKSQLFPTIPEQTQGEIVDAVTASEPKIQCTKSVGKTECKGIKLIKALPERKSGCKVIKPQKLPIKQNSGCKVLKPVRTSPRRKVQDKSDPKISNVWDDVQGVGKIISSNDISFLKSEKSNKSNDCKRKVYKKKAVLSKNCSNESVHIDIDNFSKSTDSNKQGTRGKNETIESNTEETLTSQETVNSDKDPDMIRNELMKSLEHIKEEEKRVAEERRQLEKELITEEKKRLEDAAAVEWARIRSVDKRRWDQEIRAQVADKHQPAILKTNKPKSRRKISKPNVTSEIQKTKDNLSKSTEDEGKLLENALSKTPDPARKNENGLLSEVITVPNHTDTDEFTGYKTKNTLDKKSLMVDVFGEDSNDDCVVVESNVMLPDSKHLQKENPSVVIQQKNDSITNQKYLLQVRNLRNSVHEKTESKKTVPVQETVPVLQNKIKNKSTPKNKNSSKITSENNSGKDLTLESSSKTNASSSLAPKKSKNSKHSGKSSSKETVTVVNKEIPIASNLNELQVAKTEVAIILEPPVPSVKITPDMPREHDFNPMNAKCNLASLLETPFKCGIMDFNCLETPKFISPGFFNDLGLSSLKLLDMPTPNFPTPFAVGSTSKPITKDCTPGSYSSRPTDYSSSSSYYKPDEIEFNVDAMEQALKKRLSQDSQCSVSPEFKPLDKNEEKDDLKEQEVQKETEEQDKETAEEVIPTRVLRPRVTPKVYFPHVQPKTDKCLKTSYPDKCTVNDSCSKPSTSTKKFPQDLDLSSDSSSISSTQSSSSFDDTVIKMSFIDTQKQYSTSTPNARNENARQSVTSNQNTSNPLVVDKNTQLKDKSLKASSKLNAPMESKSKKKTKIEATRKVVQSSQLSLKSHSKPTNVKHSIDPSLDKSDSYLSTLKKVQDDNAQSESSNNSTSLIKSRRKSSTPRKLQNTLPDTLLVKCSESQNSISNIPTVSCQDAQVNMAASHLGLNTKVDTKDFESVSATKDNAITVSSQNLDRVKGGSLEDNKRPLCSPKSTEEDFVTLHLSSDEADIDSTDLNYDPKSTSGKSLNDSSELFQIQNFIANSCSSDGGKTPFQKNLEKEGFDEFSAKKIEKDLTDTVAIEDIFSSNCSKSTGQLNTVNVSIINIENRENLKTATQVTESHEDENKSVSTSLKIHENVDTSAKPTKLHNYSSSKPKLENKEKKDNDSVHFSKSPVNKKDKLKSLDSTRNIFEDNDEKHLENEKLKTDLKPKTDNSKKLKYSSKSHYRPKESHSMNYKKSPLKVKTSVLKKNKHKSPIKSTSRSKTSKEIKENISAEIKPKVSKGYKSDANVDKSRGNENDVSMEAKDVITEGNKVKINISPSSSRLPDVSEILTPSQNISADEINNSNDSDDSDDHVTWETHLCNDSTDNFKTILHRSLKRRPKLMPLGIDFDNFRVSATIVNPETNTEEERNVQFTNFFELFTIDPFPTANVKNKSWNQKTQPKRPLELLMDECEEQNESIQDISELNYKSEEVTETETSIAINSILTYDESARSPFFFSRIEEFPISGNVEVACEKLKKTIIEDILSENSCDEPKVDHRDDFQSETTSVEIHKTPEHADKRKRQDCEEDSDERDEENSKKAKFTPQYLLKQLDIESILTKIHGP